jgi:hypothetical protein
MIFRGKLFFLSNFYPCRVEFEGMVFACVEAAFQAAKTLDRSVRGRFPRMDGREAKAAGRRVPLRPDWSRVRLEVMESCLRSKFSSTIAMATLKGVPGEIVEDNTWGDYFWGRCNGRGENNLGKLLMKIRDGG